MKKLEYTIRFVTPAFLGNAEQKAQWRTPSFKALLRQWWRVVKAKELLEKNVSPNSLHTEIRKHEGRLFGHAWLEKTNDQGKWAMRSRVLLRLNPWASGGLAHWDRSGIGQVSDGKQSVPADVYLGYGPVSPKSKPKNKPQPYLTNPPAIGAREKAVLSIMFPEECQQEMHDTLTLINVFGAIGSRSRNGWGSLQLDEALELDANEIGAFTRPFEPCFELDWPHAIGRDTKPLLWKTDISPSWQTVVNTLGQVRKDMRMEVKGLGSGRMIKATHILGYPVTKNDNPRWGSKERLASQIRFKVMQTAEGHAGLITHVPCAVPERLLILLDEQDRRWVRDNQARIWQEIHKVLDGMTSIDRIEGSIQ
ncbi:MAG: hypothetical protein ABFS45_08115 [Pseudomonadota bacterium]